MDVVNLYDLAGHSPACFWIGGYESDPLNNVNINHLFGILLINMGEPPQLTICCSDVLLERVREPDGAVLHRVGVGLPKEQVQKLPTFASQLRFLLSI